MTRSLQSELNRISRIFCDKIRSIMETQVLEGTWEEITRQASRFVGRKVRVTILEDEPIAKSKPNLAMLEALRKVEERNKNMRETGGMSSVDIIRRGRAGEMYGYESDE